MNIKINSFSHFVGAFQLAPWLFSSHQSSLLAFVGASPHSLTAKALARVRGVRIQVLAETPSPTLLHQMRTAGRAGRFGTERIESFRNG